jgi:AraC-like DNA-binding protein
MHINAVNFSELKVKTFPMALAGIGICLGGSKLKFLNGKTDRNHVDPYSVAGIFPIESENYLSPHQPVTRNISITLSHQGINRLLGIPLYELYCTNINLDILFGSELRQLIDQLENLENEVELVSCLDKFFIKRLRRGKLADDRAIFRIMEILNGSKTVVSVRDLAYHMNMHVRTLERIFTTNIGLTPKELLRIRRFIRLKAHIIGDPQIHWSDLILKCGFYDQAHLNHEISKVTHMAPADFFQMARTLK